MSSAYKQFNLPYLLISTPRDRLCEKWCEVRCFANSRAACCQEVRCLKCTMLQTHEWHHMQVHAVGIESKTTGRKLPSKDYSDISSRSASLKCKQLSLSFLVDSAQPGNISYKSQHSILTYTEYIEATFVGLCEYSVINIRSNSNSFNIRFDQYVWYSKPWEGFVSNNFSGMLALCGFASMYLLREGIVACTRDSKRDHAGASMALMSVYLRGVGAPPRTGAVTYASCKTHGFFDFCGVSLS